MEVLKSVARASKHRVLQWPMNQDQDAVNYGVTVGALFNQLDFGSSYTRVIPLLMPLIETVSGKLGPELFQQQESEGCDRLVAYLEGLMPVTDAKPILQIQQDVVDWEEAFFMEAGSASAPTPTPHLLSKLDGYAGQWDGGVAWQAPFTAVVQSSGWGKSRAICDLRKHGIFVVYCSLMKPEYTGFPRRSEVAKCFDAEITQHVVCAYLKACLEVLIDSDMSAEQWLQCQIRRNVKNIVGEAILERYRTVLPEMLGKTDMELQQSLLQVVQELHKKKRESLRQNGKLKVLFTFDEGKGLKDFNTTFPVFCKAMSHLPVGCGLFVVFADTDASVANFTPHRDLDPSGRVRKHGQRLFDPIHLIGKADLFAPDTTPWRSGKKGDLVPERMFMHGRPLWGVHFLKSKGEAKQVHMQELVKFATWKLLGGKSVQLSEGLTKQDAAAVFMACIGPEVLSRSYLAQDLVAGHMATCVATADERQRVLIMSMSEAVLGEAAAFILHQLGFLVHALGFLADLLTEGLVLEGVRGELVVRMVFLLCMHKCANVPTGESTGMSFYTGCVTLGDFLKTMFGEDWKANRCSSKHLDAVVCFNHFVPLGRGVEITKQRLWEFLTHGAAILYSRGEYVSDIGIPWVKFDARGKVVDVGIFEVQVKNLLCLTTALTSELMKKRQKRMFSGQDVSPLMILNLGVKDYNLYEEQTATVAFGISREMYPFLDEVVVQSLMKVLKAETNFRAHVTEKEVELVKAMAVLSL